MIDITVEGEVATAQGPFPIGFLKTLGTLSGRKHFKNGQCRFDATPSNVKRLKESDHQFNWIDKTGDLAEAALLEEMSTQFEVATQIPTIYQPQIDPRKYQSHCISLSWDRNVYAWLFEMGLGKTLIAIWNLGLLYLKRKITGVIILAPKGVDEEWLTQHLPANLDPAVEINAVLWSEGKTKQELSLRDPTKLNVLAINHDAIRTEAGFDIIEKFLHQHYRRSMFIVDESHKFMNYSAERTKNLIKLGKLATYRRILTGTPIGKTIMDMWAQFLFLDGRILGHNTAISFKRQFCVLDQNKVVVDQKDTEEFYRLIAPHAYRLTEKEAGIELPPVIPITKVYALSDKTKKHYDELKLTWMTLLDSGEYVDAANRCVAMLRLQQICCGYLPRKDGSFADIGAAERIDTLLDIVKQTTGKTIIWARFTEDIARIVAILEKTFEVGCAVTYFGGLTENQKATNKQQFIEGEPRFFVSNPSVGGTGLDGLQHVTKIMIYYSNSFNAIDRWQSTKRVAGARQKFPLMIFDIVANGTVDRGILYNLKKKKSIADLTLDEIRQSIKNDPLLNEAVDDAALKMFDQ